VSPLTQPFAWLGQAIGISWRWLVRLVREHKPRGWDWLIIAAIVIVSLLPYPYEPSGEFTVLPNARADVRAQVAGEVRAVLIKEGDLVQAGQVLARLADEDEKAQVSGAEAALIKLQSQLALAKAGHKPEEIAASPQQVNTAATKAQFSRQEADRLARAFQRKAVSEQDYMHALSTAEINEQQLIEAKRNLALVSSPTRDEEIKGIEAEIEHQKSALEYARIQLGYTEVRTPIAGHVVSGSLQFAVGDYLQRGQQLASVEDTDHVQVEILMPEDDINEIKVGSRAWAKLWGVPNSSFPGRVTRIAPSAQAQPYGKVVRVYMELDRPVEQFKPQMTGYAKVRGHWYPLIMAFIRPILRFILVEFWSWLP
jgi:multidrug resistance efflux pump